MAKNENLMQKTFTISFKYANIFAFRTICKECHGSPTRAYFVMNKDLSQENFELLLKRKPMNIDIKMKDSYLMDMFVKYRSFKPGVLFDREVAVERSVFVPNSKNEPSTNEISCVIECDCGATCWKFTNSRRKHIHNRKAQKFIPVRKSARLL